MKYILGRESRSIPTLFVSRGTGTGTEVCGTGTNFVGGSRVVVPREKRDRDKNDWSKIVEFFVLIFLYEYIKFIFYLILHGKIT